MPADEKILVRHNAVQNRYEAVVGERTAVCDYLMEGERMVFTHTFVPPELRGRGMAEKLVRMALDDAVTAKRSVVPACSYVAAFIQRHPEYQSLVA